MSKKNKYTLIASSVIVLVLILDQILKIWVKTHLALGQTVSVIGHWFNLCFVENEGMAFGFSFGHNVGKLILSLLRIALVVLICWYMHRQIKQEKMNGFSLVVFSLIVAGALGNIIDSLFYGLIFSESSFFAVASAFPEGGGYAPFFFGKVVDMFYVKLFHIPDGFPLWGGSYFFPAIFNVADACITVGIFMMLIFNKRVLNMDVFQSKAKEAVPEKSVNSEDESVEPETIVESK